MSVCSWTSFTPHSTASFTTCMSHTSCFRRMYTTLFNHSERDSCNHAISLCPALNRLKRTQDLTAITSTVPLGSFDIHFSHDIYLQSAMYSHLPSNGEWYVTDNWFFFHIRKSSPPECTKKGPCAPLKLWKKNQEKKFTNVVYAKSYHDRTDLEE